MFSRALGTLAIAGASVTSVPSMVVAAPAAASANGGTCSALASSYDGVEKSLALTYAEGIGDDSAPRETNRQVENSNDLARASMILTLMQAHHCVLPDHAPSDATYMTNALTCTTDRLKSTSQPASCNLETWHAGD